MVNFLLWRVLYQKLHCQDLRDIDYLKHCNLHCLVQSSRTH